MSSRKLAMPLFVAVLAGSGCATLAHGRAQEISIRSAPAGWPGKGMRDVWNPSRSAGHGGSGDCGKLIKPRAYPNPNRVRRP